MSGQVVSAEVRMARKLEALASFIRFSLRAARVAIVLALIGEAFCVGAIVRVVWLNW